MGDFTENQHFTIFQRIVILDIYVYSSEEKWSIFVQVCVCVSVCVL